MTFPNFFFFFFKSADGKKIMQNYLACKLAHIKDTISACNYWQFSSDANNQITFGIVFLITI